MKKKKLVDLQKRVPKNHAYAKYLAAYHCGSAFTQEGLASLQDHDKVEETQVDWKRGIVPLRSDSAPSKIYRVIHTIDFILQFLNSGREFIYSVLIIEQSSSRRFIDS